MEAQDRRIRRTQNLLAKALIALTLEKGYEAVTIRDITERADVGYATFFRHYHDKDALLRDAFEVVLADLKQLLPTSAATEGVAIGNALFQYVAQNNNIIRALLSSRGTSSLVEYVIDLTAKDILSGNMPLKGSIIPPEVAAYHIANSSIGLLQWWLEHDMPYPPEQMGPIYQQLILQQTYTLAFDALPQNSNNFS